MDVKTYRPNNENLKLSIRLGQNTTRTKVNCSAHGGHLPTSQYKHFSARSGASLGNKLMGERHLNLGFRVAFKQCELGKTEGSLTQTFLLLPRVMAVVTITAKEPTIRTWTSVDGRTLVDRYLQIVGRI